MSDAFENDTMTLPGGPAVFVHSSGLVLPEPRRMRPGTVSGIRSPRRRAKVLIWSLWIFAMYSLVTGLFARLSALNEVLYEVDMDLPVYDLWDSLATSFFENGSFVFFYGLAFFLTGGLWFAWTARVCSNAWDLNEPHMTQSPVGAIVWYFLPIANLAIPYLAIRETWNVSQSPADPSRARRSIVLGLWWASWLLFTLLGRGLFSVAIGLWEDYEFVGAYLCIGLGCLLGFLGAGHN